VHEWRAAQIWKSPAIRYVTICNICSITVVFEPDIGNDLAGFAERRGGDVNHNALTKIRSMVFCNACYANQAGNLKPRLLALFLLHLALS